MERVEGPGCRTGTRAPKELLHHLPALVLCRPSVSADPTERLSGLRGSRLLDRRPPHYRCPAVPGSKMSARAILMVLGSSVLPSVINCVLPVMRPASGQWKRHFRQSWNPTAELPDACARSRRLHQGAAHLPSLLSTTALTAVQLVAAPDHCGPPGPVVSPVRRPATTLATRLHHRTVLHTATSCTAGTADRQFVSARPFCLLWATGETITTPEPNVYSGHHRFSAVRRYGNRPRVGQKRGERTLCTRQRWRGSPLLRCAGRGLEGLVRHLDRGQPTADELLCQAEEHAPA